MAVSDKAWGSITEADYADAADFCSACLIDLNPSGQPKTKALCKLPYKEPAAMGGNVNRGGAHGCAGVLAGARGGVDAPMEAKMAAARKLVTVYRQDLQETPPPSLMQMAG